ncbi:MAG: hypothetical protein NNA23_05100 [Nitrospira sp.]|nr:hypothetical protein [Nitrospira sp.]
MKTIVAWVVSGALVGGWWLGWPQNGACGGSVSDRDATVPAEDYPLYDQAVERLFVSSTAPLLLIERLTVGRLLPNQLDPVTVEWFLEQEYFGGRLPRELVRDFIHVNRVAARLEGRFRFGARYRFLSDGEVEEPEAFSARVVRIAHAGLFPSSAHVAFSRIGRTLRNDQALLYVEYVQPDGGGAGFLVWFERRGEDWTILETDVVWIIRDESGEGEEFP